MLDAVGEMDLAAFYAAYRDDGWGRAAHDPAMMVALFVYAYAIGVRSSRAIERRCRDDVAFRVITANQAPDHATIARFRVRHEAAIAELFGEVLALCARSGSGQGRRGRGRRHQDRRGGDASRDAQLRADRAEILEEAAAHRRRRGRAVTARRAATSCPRGCAPAVIAASVLREAKQALEAERAAEAKKIPRDRGERLAMPAPAGAGLGARAARHHRARRVACGAGSPATGRGGWPAPGTTSSPIRCRASRRARSTSPIPTRATSRRPRGWVQGYNAQAVVDERPDRLAAEISTESLDTANLQPMIETALARTRRPPGHRDARGRVGRRRLLEERRDRSARRQGIQTLVAPDADRRKEPRPGRRGGLYDFMRRVLATDRGKQLYLRRQGIVEPVFGQIKHNRGADRFQRRGRSAVRSEWRLLTATHNLLKLHHTSSPPPETATASDPPPTRRPSARLTAAPARPRFRPQLSATPSARSTSAVTGFRTIAGRRMQQRTGRRAVRDLREASRMRKRSRLRLEVAPRT